MGKGHYHGGSTLIGDGAIVKAKGRKGGVGPSGAAIRDQQRIIDKKLKVKVGKQVEENQRKMRQLGKDWAEMRGRKAYEKLVVAKQVNSSPLAAALREALEQNDEPKA
ncbi:hypothetical protein GRI44_13070 [Altererythrobacter confluentis]|uniref:Uncharacterized protein n=1 Tax=Allopontixanthobacter confluentis TaxID=1849021 RepID=A0A6L7GM17_9SPHN|nr:hypothetical protein [Allopontixanthobacter confluentis]MXP15681.1 hypothetical protein [Allopontixanthobacter confluentis]